MSNYKGIKGFQVQTRTEDPTPYAQALADNPYAGSWASGGDMNHARKRNPGAGIQTSSVVAGGDDGGSTPTFTEVEEYNGTSWTEIAEINEGNARQSCAGANAEAILEIGGEADKATCESWNGSAWTEVGDLNTGRYDTAAGGPYTSAIVAGGSDAGSPGYQSVTETWNGSSWTETGDLNTARQAIAGDGTTTAMIVAGGTTGSNVAVSETFNGSTWTEVSDLNTARHFFSGAGSTTDVIVMGGNPRSGKTENYDGSSWSEVNDMATARDENLGRAGTGTTALMSGGNGNPGGTNIATTEEWSFTGIDPSTTPAAEYADAIVGDFYYNSTTGQFKTVNDGGAPIGTWSSGDNLNEARYVGAGNGTKTAALGISGGGAPGVTTNTEQYDGSAWTEIANVNTGRANSGGAGTTTAGLFYGGGTPTANASNESWNGTAWTEVADLNAAVRYLGGSGTSTAALQVSGSSGADVEQWDGSSWTEVADVNTSKNYNANVGTVTASLWFGGIPAVTEEWNGSAWTELSGVLNQARGAVAGAGSTPSALCFGGWNAPSAGSYAQTEAWNGTAWTEVNDLSSTRALTGSANSITTNTEALSFGGTTDGGGTQIATTDEWSADDFQIKSVTTS